MKSDAVFPSDNHCYIYTVVSPNYHTIYTPNQKQYKNIENKVGMEHPQVLYKAILDVISISNNIQLKNNVWIVIIKSITVYLSEINF